MCVFKFGPGVCVWGGGGGGGRAKNANTFEYSSSVSKISHNY